jgi:hypothetical protein
MHNHKCNQQYISIIYLARGKIYLLPLFKHRSRGNIHCYKTVFNFRDELKPPVLLKINKWCNQTRLKANTKKVWKRLEAISCLVCVKQNIRYLNLDDCFMYREV